MPQKRESKRRQKKARIRFPRLYKDTFERRDDVSCLKASTAVKAGVLLPCDVRCFHQNFGGVVEVIPPLLATVLPFQAAE